MDYEKIEVTYDEGIAVITLNDPQKMNPLGKQMFKELVDAFGSLRQNDDVGAVVLTGKGKAFSAGGDVRELASGEMQVGTFLEGRIASKEIIMAIRSFEKPLICAVNGIAAGGGAGLVLCSDIVFASEQASFSVIFRRIGMIPDCGVLYTLPQIVGPAKAKELVFSGEIIDAQEMLRLGLAQHVVRPEEVLPKAIAFSKICALGPRSVLSLSKILIERASSVSVEEYFDYESLALPIVMNSNDFHEGIDAFLNKRLAEFCA